VQSGASLVVRAMASGHAAADALDAWCHKTKD
jgi:NADPH-dependent glutamate synthase beta subunit-like oxidoreductase